MEIGFFRSSKSKTRRAILELFFNHPESEYYLRQIENITGYSVGNIRREMLRLEKGGLFVSRILGNLKLYKLKTNNPIYNEIKNIIRKTIGIEGSLRGIVDEYRKIRFAFIYGSFAKDEQSPESDIDVIIIGEARPKEIKAVLYKYQSEIKREINSIVYSENEFLRKIKEKNHFICSIIKEPKIFLKGSEDELGKFIKVR
jgi:predicted nucleotidyltransferase